MKQYRFNTQKRYKEKKTLKKNRYSKTDFVKQMNFISRDTDQKI